SPGHYVCTSAAIEATKTDAGTGRVQKMRMLLHLHPRFKDAPLTRGRAHAQLAGGLRHVIQSGFTQATVLLNLRQRDLEGLGVSVEAIGADLTAIAAATPGFRLTVAEPMER